MAEDNNNGGVFRKEEQTEINFSDIWGMIWGNRWWYVLSLVVCIVFAGFYLYRTPGTYSRSAKLIINEDAQDATLRDIANISGFAGQGASVNVNNEVEAFSSPDLMATVVERLGLETSYVEHQFLRDRELYKTSPFEMAVLQPLVSSSFSFRVRKTGDSTFVLSGFTIGPEKVKRYSIEGTLGDTLSTSIGDIVLYPSAYNIGSWDDDITVSWTNSSAKAKTYTQRLSASVSGKQTSVVVLSLEDTYPSRAEDILSTLINTYNDEWVHDKNRSARNTTEFINERLVVIEQELGGIETSLKEYKEQNRLTDMQALSQSYLDESTEYAARSFEEQPAFDSPVHPGLPYGSGQRPRPYPGELRPDEHRHREPDLGVQPAGSPARQAHRHQQREQPSDSRPQCGHAFHPERDHPLDRQPPRDAQPSGGEDPEPGGPDHAAHLGQFGTADGASWDRAAAEGDGVPVCLPPAET